MKVKVCGMKEPENIKQLLALPVDFIGFVFHDRSPRFAGKSKLDQWISKNKSLFSKTKKVGVFVNGEIEHILNVVHDYQLDYVQLHGTESPEYCRELKQYWDISTLHQAQIIKAFSVDEDFDFRDTRDYEAECAYFLFDTKGALPGGTGMPFDWSLLEKYRGKTPFFLSGGIGESAWPAIRKLDAPALFAIDVNSQFETAPGVKDIAKLEGFLKKKPA